jgi:hypothetical protein
MVMLSLPGAVQPSRVLFCSPGGTTAHLFEMAL